MSQLIREEALPIADPPNTFPKLVTTSTGTYSTYEIWKYRQTLTYQYDLQVQPSFIKAMGSDLYFKKSLELSRKRK